MKYIMVTSWSGHWNSIRNNRTLFTERMLRGIMNKDLLKPMTKTLFIKRNKDTRILENAWTGKVYDFKDTKYKEDSAIEFTVDIEKEIKCPKKYLNYDLGWYVEGISENGNDVVKVNIWKEIEIEYEKSKKSFGKQINFVKDTFKRDIIFRDVAHAYSLLKGGFSKPAVILAGGVIEELLRLYLMSKKIGVSGKSFEEYVEICIQKGLLKNAISSLTTSTRHFRNLVHLRLEKSQRDTISKSTATMAVASIFSIVNDFERYKAE